ncbi:hypothetical protein K2173_001029 [Erythroxylum novogranatense]|uniref:Uncharacterized protein n=1 Tax=Erythroxylum novogranatense TaxID=1862640 RepID=A0AAV8SIX1_9ROSI|nr:hypothetical protein K2173_001029 [Erythroxylum novogranatense]
MQKKSEHSADQHQELEIMKAVAQAWHSHSSSSSRPASECDARRPNFQGRPSRFKLEAMNKASVHGVGGVNWDFKQSLLDSYEIVTVTKKLERGLASDDPFSALEEHNRVHRRRKEEVESILYLTEPNPASTRKKSQAFFI